MEGDTEGFPRISNQMQFQLELLYYLIKKQELYMISTTLIPMYERDLNKLKDEISAYNPESNLWVIKNEIKNSAGNLCLHISGGLQYMIGALLGGTSYVRNRDAEFSLKNIPKTDLLTGVDDARQVVTSVLGSLTESDLKKIFPVKLGNNDVTNEYVIIHLYGHLNYHLGQINYHRRLTAV